MDNKNSRPIDENTYTLDLYNLKQNTDKNEKEILSIKYDLYNLKQSNEIIKSQVNTALCVLIVICLFLMFSTNWLQYQINVK